MEYKVVENKTATIIGNIGLAIFLFSVMVSIISLLLSLIINKDIAIYGLSVFVLSIPVSALFLMISNCFSTRDKDTRVFLNQIRKELKLAKSIPDLTIVRDKLVKEAVDKNGMIRISFPLSVKELIKEIDYKVEILENHV